MPLRFTYKDAGVDQESADAFAGNIQRHMRRTFGPQVLDNPGGYGGLFALEGTAWLMGKRFRKPVLVGCTDGVGTKLKIAFLTGKHDTVGIDLVAMCVNDLVCEGAKPLFFLDYMATGKLDTAVLEAVLKGVADGCEQSDCALIGGETAQMPDFYRAGEYDLAGFAVGMVERDRLMEKANVEPGHAIIGVASSGLHSNGYSLVRKLVFDHAKLKVTDTVADLGGTVGEALLEPTRIYVRAVQRLRHVYEVKRIPSGIAHITGGGLPGNVARILPENCVARIKRGSWEMPPIFPFLQKLGDLDDEEMFRTFNMGLGMVLFAPPYYADAVLRRVRKQGHTAWFVGEVREGARAVSIVK